MDKMNRAKVRRCRAGKIFSELPRLRGFLFYFRLFGGQIPDKKRVGYLPHLWGGK
jgi:hypothetical protein